MALSLPTFGLLLILTLIAHTASTLALTAATSAALDQWNMFYYHYPAGLTSQPVVSCSPNISTGDSSDEADQALANSKFSRGYFPLGAGESTFTFTVIDVDDDDRAWFKVTSVDCNALLNPAPPAPVVNSTQPGTTTNSTTQPGTTTNSTTLPDTDASTNTTLPASNSTSTLPTTNSTTSNTKAHPAHPAHPDTPVAETRPPVAKPVAPAKPHLKLNDADGATTAAEPTAETPRQAASVAVGPAMLAGGAVVFVAVAGVVAIVQRRRRFAARGHAVSTEEGEAAAASRMIG
ncbi:hypothetical protein GGF31_000418 [Allomyces arbusculus]|nr:hypothetical protein GGF31_000418 [Allomyces arbusculus]